MNIESIIKQRLNLQSTKRALSNDFEIDPSLDVVLSKSFSEKYSAWSEEKRNKFIVALGGKVNFNKTKELLEYKLRDAIILSELTGQSLEESLRDVTVSLNSFKNT